MPKCVLLTIVFIVTEIFIAFIFAVIAQVFYHKIGFNFKAIFKGLIERLFLFIALVNGYSQALTLFSALKLATRLKHHDDPNEMDSFNDYYLLGNLISVAVAIGYVYIYQHFESIQIFKTLTS
jgi:hypothetical protein